MTQKMFFDDVAEYERFNKMYNDYIQKGVESTKALAMTKEAFWPTKELSKEGRKAYDDYIFKFGLSPEDAYILASRKKDAPKVEEKTEPKEEKKAEAPAPKSWFEDWINPMFDAEKWFDTLKPFNSLLDDSFIKKFATPCWIDFWDEHKPHGNGKCKCNREGEVKQTDNAVAKPNKGLDIVNDEIRKVLGEIPKEEVNAENTKVNIVKSDPNDYEYKVDHSSPDGKSKFHCHKIFRKF